ncbi:MAG: CYTH and CHAD domain-containing protein [Burkholderiales bacterium]|nr:CYTH and CHAD domain-containing protein [Burkholderiales bacterium]
MTAARRRSRRAAAALPVETELKLAIAPEAIATLTRHPALRSCKRGRARTVRLLSRYYDTEDGALAAAGIALRLRREGRRWLQTVKGPASAASAAGLSARAEYEWPVAGDRLDPLRFATTTFRRTLGKALQRGLVPRFVTDVKRTTVPLTFADSTMALLCIDSGEVRTDDDRPIVRAPLHEIEIELETGEVARLFELAHALAADVPLAFEPASKAERGYALRHPASPKPLYAADIDLSRKSDAGTAFAAIIRACLRQIEGNAQGVRSGRDPEWIHQMRIGVRRLRACLSLARKAMPTARVEPLRVELRWLAQALGPARDFDVFATETLPAFREAVLHGGATTAPLATALEKLAVRAAARRREAHAGAQAAVASPRFVRLLLSTAALAAAPGSAVLDGDAHADPLAAPMRDYARPLLKRRHHDLLALGTDLAHAAPEARHAARLAAKKLRYATEFFASLYPKKRTRAYRKALAALQDELGTWNDAVVAARIAGEIAGAQSPPAAAFGGWAAARGVERGEIMADAWRRFSKAQPFWSHA